MEAGLDGYSPTLRLLPSRFLLLHFLLLLTSSLESPNSPIDVQRTYLQTRLPQHRLRPMQSPLGITTATAWGSVDGSTALHRRRHRWNPCPGE